MRLSRVCGWCPQTHQKTIGWLSRFTSFPQIHFLYPATCYRCSSKPLVFTFYTNCVLFHHPPQWFFRWVECNVCQKYTNFLFFILNAPNRAIIHKIVCVFYTVELICNYTAFQLRFLHNRVSCSMAWGVGDTLFALMRLMQETKHSITCFLRFTNPFPKIQIDSTNCPLFHNRPSFLPTLDSDT